jgi:putative endonuclease
VSEHNELGAQGEKVAQSYLKKKKYKLLETNWRYRHAEIDIICMQADVLVFVEVKTRTSDHFGRPEEFVSKKKERLMFKAANEYMEQIDHKWVIRFDVISIILQNKKVKQIEHFEDFFFPDVR